jgi:hypothetical protein
MDEPPEFPCLPSELWVHVIAQGGPALLAPCSSLCTQLHEAAAESSELWSYFARRCFAVADASDWRPAFIACAVAWPKWRLPAYAGGFHQADSPFRVQPSQSQGEPEAEPPPRPLAATVVGHTDERGMYALMYPAAAALLRVHQHPAAGSLQMCWCTSNHHDRNVGLLVRLDAPTLVSGIGVVNPAEGFDCPVKLCLAFASMEENEGLAGAMRRAAPFLDGGRDAPSRAAVARRSAECPSNLEAVTPPPANPLDQRWGAWGRDAPGAGEPIVAINFPAPPACDGMHIVQPCAPTAARFVLFLIVNGYNPNSHDGPNIDVSKLQVFGTPVPELECEAAVDSNVASSALPTTMVA